jgi:hypothetical protein
MAEDTKSADAKVEPVKTIEPAATTPKTETERHTESVRS